MPLRKCAAFAYDVASSIHVNHPEGAVKHLSTFLLAAVFATVVPFEPAEARTPARQKCELTKAQQKRAVKQAQQQYPQVKAVAKERACVCVLGSEDCSQREVRLTPVEFQTKAGISFRLRVQVQVSLKPDPNRLPAGASKPVDFEKLGAAIGKLRLTKRLFEGAALTCDAREQYGSLDFACGVGDDPRAALGGGRPGHGAHVFSAHLDRKGKVKTHTIAGPATLVKKLDDVRWLRISDNAEVVGFLEKHPSATIALIGKDEVAIHAPASEANGVEVREVLHSRDGKVRVSESRRSGPFPAKGRLGK